MAIFLEFGSGDGILNQKGECYIPIKDIEYFLKNTFNYNGYSSTYNSKYFEVEFNVDKKQRFKSFFMNILDFFTNFYNTYYFKKQLVLLLEEIGYNDISVDVIGNKFIFVKEKSAISKLKYIANNF